MTSFEIVDILKDVTALYVISSLDNAFFSIARRGFFGKYLLLKTAKAEMIGISLMQTEIETSHAAKEEKCWINGTIIKSFILHLIIGVAMFFCKDQLEIVDTTSFEYESLIKRTYPSCEKVVPSFNSNWNLVQNYICDMVSI